LKIMISHRGTFNICFNNIFSYQWIVRNTAANLRKS
jgi:hypothetical protein